MTEQDLTPSVIEEISFTKHPELRLEDLEIELDTGRETVHETTNFRILFKAYWTLKAALKSSDEVDETTLTALKLKLILLNVPTWIQWLKIGNP